MHWERQIRERYRESERRKRRKSPPRPWPAIRQLESVREWPGSLFLFPSPGFQVGADSFRCAHLLQERGRRIAFFKRDDSDLGSSAVEHSFLVLVQGIDGVITAFCINGGLGELEKAHCSELGKNSYHIDTG